MDLPDLKRWHWVIIGLIAGLALAGMRIFWGPDYRDSTARTLSQEQFEGSLLRPSSPLRLTGLLVYPPEEEGACWVTGRFSEDKSYASPGGDNAGPRIQTRVSGAFKYKASGAYKPRFWFQGMPHGQTTLRSYLDEISSRLPGGQVSYRYAWYEQKNAVVAIWTGAAVLLVGGIWPILLNILTGAGLGRRAAESGPSPDLRQIKHEPLPPAAVPPTPPRDQEAIVSQVLLAMAEKIEQSVSSTPSVAAATPPTPPPVRPLVSEPLAPDSSVADGERKSFGADKDDYYPTERHFPHPTSEERR